MKSKEAMEREDYQHSNIPHLLSNNHIKWDEHEHDQHKQEKGRDKGLRKEGRR